MGLSYMKCGKVECEKGRMLGGQFCEEHALTTLLTGLRGLRAAGQAMRDEKYVVWDVCTYVDCQTCKLGRAWDVAVAALDTLVRTVEGDK